VPPTIAMLCGLLIVNLSLNYPQTNKVNLFICWENKEVKDNMRVGTQGRSPPKKVPGSENVRESGQNLAEAYGVGYSKG
jgi:hypothetical protein